jgi:hypothetical protein
MTRAAYLHLDLRVQQLHVLLRLLIHPSQTLLSAKHIADSAQRRQPLTSLRAKGVQR